MAMHRIRLRGPWEIRWKRLEPGAPLDGVGLRHPTTSGESPPLDNSPSWVTRRVTMPQDWHTGPWMDGPSYVELTRIFHCPTGLAYDQRVDLTITTKHAITAIQLNDVALSLARNELSSPEMRCQIGSLLQETNRLFVALVIDAAPSIEQPIWETWLEVFDDPQS